jgi:molybdopterin-guanine dinucleotide biosynthesis protein A
MIWGLVLAGGRSTRMGRDKATLVVGGNGERLVDRVVAAAAGALRAAGERAPRVLVSGAVEGHECVRDAAEGLGPVAGLASALDLALAERARPTHLLALPVDLPNVTAGALAPLLACTGAPAAHHDGSALPALLRVDEATRATVREVLASEGRERSVTRLLALLGAHAIPLDPAHTRALANANTPEELRDALVANAPRTPGGGRR